MTIVHPLCVCVCLCTCTPCCFDAVNDECLCHTSACLVAGSVSVCAPSLPPPSFPPSLSSPPFLPPSLPPSPLPPTPPSLFPTELNLLNPCDLGWSLESLVLCPPPAMDYWPLQSKMTPLSLFHQCWSPRRPTLLSREHRRCHHGRGIRRHLFYQDQTGGQRRASICECSGSRDGHVTTDIRTCVLSQSWYYLCHFGHVPTGFLCSVLSAAFPVQSLQMVAPQTILG